MTKKLIGRLRALAWNERAPGGEDEQVLYLTDAIQAVCQQAELPMPDSDDGSALGRAYKRGFDHGLLAAPKQQSVPESEKMKALEENLESMRQTNTLLVKRLREQQSSEEVERLLLEIENLRVALHAERTANGRTESWDVVERVALAMLNAGRKENGQPTVASFDGFADEDVAFWRRNAKAACSEIPVNDMGAVAPNGVLSREEDRQKPCPAPATQRPDESRRKVAIDILYDLDELARDYDQYEFGLPLYSKMPAMIDLIVKRLPERESSDRLIADLSMLVKRMARRLSMLNEPGSMHEVAIEFLRRHGLEGSPLREDEQGTRGPDQP